MPASSVALTIQFFAKDADDARGAGLSRFKAIIKARSHPRPRSLTAGVILLWPTVGRAIGQVVVARRYKIFTTRTEPGTYGAGGGFDPSRGDKGSGNDRRQINGVALDSPRPRGLLLRDRDIGFGLRQNNDVAMLARRGRTSAVGASVRRSRAQSEEPKHVFSLRRPFFCN